jgi:putative colanic acid biosynthesis glycosyltransferase
MKVLQINAVINSGSTGKIAEQIGILLQNTGNESYIAYGRNPKPSSSEIFRIGSNLQIGINGLETRLFDNHAFGLKIGTKQLIEYIKKIKPDIVHLHNLHGYYINIHELLSYLKNSSLPVIMTLHDCWTFTGHCAHFDFIGCEKWKTHCMKCPQIRSYPASLFIDRSYKNYKLKRELFNSIDKLIIVPVSDWLNGLVQKSFLASKKRIVIKNGIDLNIFKPAESKENVIRKYNLQGKYIVLGVASVWDERKGLNDIMQIADSLAGDYSIIIVGGRINKDVKKISNVTIIEKTENQAKLVELYSAADLFINPTYEDTLPTTNMEALACGTPVLTYNSGGSPELIDDETGFVVPKGNVDAMVDIIKQFPQKGKDSMTSACRKRAEKYFNKDERFMDYIKLYEKVFKGDI